MEKNVIELKQKIVAVLVISVMFILIFTTLNLNPNFYTEAATTDANISITAGTLSIDSSAAIYMGSVVAGNAQNIAANNMVVNVKDFSGDGLNWAATVYSTNFANGTNLINNTQYNIIPSAGLVYNIAGSSCAQTALGSTCTLNQQCSLINGSPNAVGECRLNYVELNLTVPASATLGVYNATLTLTVSAS